MKKNIRLDSAGKPTGHIDFTFDDNVAAYTFDCDCVSDVVAQYAMPFGMCHRLGDAAALSKKDFPNGITESDRRAAVVALGAHYETGTDDWNTRVSAGPKHHAHIEALATKWGVTYEEAMAKLADLTGL